MIDVIKNKFTCPSCNIYSFLNYDSMYDKYYCSTCCHEISKYILNFKIDEPPTTAKLIEDFITTRKGMR